MTRASDAQGALLACLDDHRVDGEPVFTHYHGGARVELLVERDDHGPLHGVQNFVAIDPSYSALLHARLPSIRVSTLMAAERRGWVRRHPDVAITTQHIGTCWTGSPADHLFVEFSITDDGRIALGIWRQRKLAEPPQELPVLEGRGREVVATAYICNGLGYAMVPVTETARREARQLARGPFLKRGWGGGASTRSVESTAAGAVEVAPADADSAGPLSLWDMVVREQAMRVAGEEDVG